MNRILSIGFLLLYIVPYTYSQTYYYQLNKIASGNETNLNVTGGQFITFMADICYESAKNGMNVGHGKLTKKSANAQFKEYRGDSYWGTATFKFKSDLSKLNVITDDGEVWVYTRTTAPASAKTCSLIRKRGPRKVIPFLLLITFNFEALIIGSPDGLVVCFSLSGAWTL